MTVDFATLAVGNDVAWVRSDGPGRPWAAVRFGTVRRVLKTRVVVRFGAEDARDLAAALRAAADVLEGR